MKLLLRYSLRWNKWCSTSFFFLLVYSHITKKIGEHFCARLFFFSSFLLFSIFSRLLFLFSFSTTFVFSNLWWNRCHFLWCCCPPSWKWGFFWFNSYRHNVSFYFVCLFLLIYFFLPVLGLFWKGRGWASLVFGNGFIFCCPFASFPFFTIFLFFNCLTTSFHWLSWISFYYLYSCSLFSLDFFRFSWFN